MTIWCVVPFRRETERGRVESEFHRQRYQDKHLLLVRDGEGPDAAADQVTELFSGTRGISEALNAGLAYARRNGRSTDWFCKWDDDDYYGPGYLDSIQLARELGATAAGRSALWMKTGSGRLWYVEGPRGFRPGTLHGSTLAASLDCPDFEHVDRSGEDTRWVYAQRRAGARIWLCPPGGHCYIRYLDPGHRHAWPVPEASIPALHPWPLFDCGPANPDLVETDEKPPWAIPISATLTAADIDRVFAP